MFRATALSGFVVCGSQRSACSFTMWLGNFGIQDFLYRPRLSPCRTLPDFECLILFIIHSDQDTSF